MKRNLVMFTSEDCTSLVPSSVSEFKRHIGDFGPQVKVTVTVETYRRKRSLSQNNLLHKYLSKMAEHLGYETETMKDAMKHKFGVRETMYDKNGEEIVDPESGEIQEKIKDTRDYTTIEMMEFVDKVRQFSIDVMGYYLPTPDQLKENNIKW